MDNQSYQPRQTERHLKRHLQLWIYLLPVVGAIPAIWTLYRPQSDATPSRVRQSPAEGNPPAVMDSPRRRQAQGNAHQESDRQNTSEDYREQQKVSRLSLTLVLVWLSSYSLLFLGAGHTSGIVAFRFLYANAILTTGYFLACAILMSRLVKQEFPSRHEARNLP